MLLGGWALQSAPQRPRLQRSSLAGQSFAPPCRMRLAARATPGALRLLPALRLVYVPGQKARLPQGKPVPFTAPTALSDPAGRPVCKHAGPAAARPPAAPPGARAPNLLQRHRPPRERVARAIDDAIGALPALGHFLVLRRAGAAAAGRSRFVAQRRRPLRGGPGPQPTDHRRHHGLRRGSTAGAGRGGWQCGWPVLPALSCSPAPSPSTSRCGSLYRTDPLAPDHGKKGWRFRLPSPQTTLCSTAPNRPQPPSKSPERCGRW